MISRMDIESTLGSSINNLLFYNIKKWVLMRSSVFKHLSANEINKIIISFETFMVEDKTKVDSRQYKGFIICLEGTINDIEKGTKIFNEKNWLNKSYKCDS